MATFGIFADSKIPRLNIKKHLLPFKNIKSPLQSKEIRTAVSQNKIPRTPFSRNHLGLNDVTNIKSKSNFEIFRSPITKLTPHKKKSALLENVNLEKVKTKLLFDSPLVKLTPSKKKFPYLENAVLNRKKTKLFQPPSAKLNFKEKKSAKLENKENAKLYSLDELKPKTISLINQLDLDTFLNKADFVQHSCPKNEISERFSQFLKIKDFNQPDDEPTFEFPDEPPFPVYEDLEVDVLFFQEKPPNINITSFSFDDDVRPNFIFSPDFN